MIKIEIKKGSTIKKELHEGGKDETLHQPCPFYYGYIIGTLAPDGDPEDAIVITENDHEVGDEVDYRERGTLYMKDEGGQDNKRVFADRPITEEDIDQIKKFITEFKKSKGEKVEIKGFKKFWPNQTRPDPRQGDFLTRYLDPSSDTFSNATRSAVAAGYSQEYAENILSARLMPEWLSEAIGDGCFVKKAERNLQDMLDLEILNRGVTKRGEVYEFDDTGKLRVKADITKFVLERLNKKKYSQRTEVGLDEGLTAIKIEVVNGTKPEDKPDIPKEQGE